MRLPRRVSPIGLRDSRGQRRCKAQGSPFITPDDERITLRSASGTTHRVVQGKKGDAYEDVYCVWRSETLEGEG